MKETIEGLLTVKEERKSKDYIQVTVIGEQVDVEELMKLIYTKYFAHLGAL